MATEGTREGGSSMNRGQGKYFDREKRPGGGTRFQKSDRSGAPRGDRQAGGDRPPRGNGNRSYGEKSYGDRPYGDRPPRNERQTETTEVLLSFRKRMRMRKTEAEEASHPVQRRVSRRSQFRTKIRSRCA